MMDCYNLPVALLVATRCRAYVMYLCKYCNYWKGTGYVHVFALFSELSGYTCIYLPLALLVATRCHAYVRLSMELLQLWERDWILTVVCIILRAFWIVLSPCSFLSCYQVPCICKIIRGINAAIGKGLDTHMVCLILDAFWIVLSCICKIIRGIIAAMERDWIRTWFCLILKSK